MNDKPQIIKLTGTMSELQLMWKIKDLENGQQIACEDLTIQIFSSKGELLNPDDFKDEMKQKE